MTPFETSGALAAASSPSSFGQARGMTAPCLRSGREHRAFSFSCDQLLVGDAALGRGGNQAIQPLEGVALHVPLVEPEGELVDVAAKVFVAGVVIDAVQPALQDSPNGLDAVRVDAIARVFARAVV